MSSKEGRRATPSVLELAHWLYVRIGSAAPHRQWSPSRSSRAVRGYAALMTPLSRSALSAPFFLPGHTISEERLCPQRSSGGKCVPDSGGSVSQRSHSAADAEEQLMDHP
ncbi:hypothetical protein NDU88_002200 [Pleurodeles waltl]|uniref:Uncharacterized protein n=1 Tax=Pleurodeles waltl TaxID=8319 RepID=A0AAV7U8L0_PLEWA|nr:hypothetical protein NDU88_002200 [Pleurodeles waltl]